MTYFIETYGCQMNKAESAALVLVLHEQGWSAAPSGADADLVLINTCTVRATAETRVRGRVAFYAALKKKRCCTLIVTGCAASQLKTAQGVDYTLETNARSLFPALLRALETGIPFVADAEKPVFAFSSAHLAEGSFKSFVPIMHGCNNFCTYCIVPYVRGPEISRDPSAILREIELLAAKGVREICLLGQNVNSYHWDSGSESFSFARLLRLIVTEIEQTPIRWVRFLSANPKDFSLQTLEVMAAHPVLCRHLHLCVQHGSNRILAAMNRLYTREQYLELVKKIREYMPDITLSTDILIGFPGETEDDLALTVDLMEQVRFIYAFMYHYNRRVGTAADQFPDHVPDLLKRERLARIIALQKQHTQEYLRNRIGESAPVLVERSSPKNPDELLCRTAQDEMVVTAGPASLIGSFAVVQLLSLQGNTFRGLRLTG
ncbi:MAG: tRNA (N6-isopentenyl adenosine(37)-C2)-methylthiotransferase MiaB [Spirochaetaceae bacterium]|jgi:tRNA-2-methylthio-N6-dimethylallyladenosine synthase|nr:tRNA (N6-isopentenyl adenosine(37)-C2)-methylthiotransferase MiaB [Spirochaetaceae bacterium]